MDHVRRTQPPTIANDREYWWCRFAQSCHGDKIFPAEVSVCDGEVEFYLPGHWESFGVEDAEWFGPVAIPSVIQ